MAMLGKIRRMFYRDNLSLSDISRRTSISRNTIKKWLRAPGSVEPKYQRQHTERKLAPFLARLNNALETDSHRPKRDRRTAKKLWQEIRADGFTGSYSRVTEFVRKWRANAGQATANKAFVPLKKARTAQGNQIRGLLSEFGIVIPQGIDAIAKRIPEILEDAENGLPGTMRHLLDRLTANLKAMDRQVDELETQIQRWHNDNAASKKLAGIPGIGPITASAMVASVGDAREFKNGRQMAAWLGLVPRQHSSGGKQSLVGISKRGDVYCHRWM